MSYSSEVLADSPDVWERLDAVDPTTVSAATASSNYPTDTPAQAFDGNPVTPWSSNGTSTGWIRAQLSSAKILTDYVLTSRASFPTRAPKNWTFEGSNDGSTWTTLDTRTGVTWTSGQTRVFSFANSTAYLYYRLNVTLNNGDTYLDLAEMSFPYSADSSGNGRYLVQPTGTAPTIVAGGPVLSTAMRFGSSAGWLRSGYEQASPGVGTFEVWVKFAANPSATVTLLSWSPNNGGNGSCLYLQLLTSGKIRLGLYNGTTVNCDTTSALTTGAWHHVIGSVGAAGMKVRIDKVTDGTNATVGANSPGSAAFRVHGRYDGASHVDMTGAVDMAEAAFYSTQLSDTRTDAHYDAAGSSAVAASGTASLALSATGAVGAVGAGSAALALSASGSAAGGAAGSASLSMSATGSLTAPEPASGTAALSLSASGTATAPSSGTAALTLTASGSAVMSAGGTATLTLSAGGVALVLYETDLSNAFDGLDLLLTATVTFAVPVAATPPGLVAAERYDKAVAYPVPVMVDGRPT